MNSALFAYGSLRLEQVMAAVCGRPLRGASARLPDYGCYRLRGRPYPGIRPHTGAITEGVIYRDLTDEDWRRLDDFEDDGCYRRDAVKLILADGSSLTAQAYVMAEHGHAELTGEPWSLERFRNENLDAFLAGCGLA